MKCWETLVHSRQMADALLARGASPAVAAYIPAVVVGVAINHLEKIEGLASDLIVVEGQSVFRETLHHV